MALLAMNVEAEAGGERTEGGGHGNAVTANRGAAHGHVGVAVDLALEALVVLQVERGLANRAC